MSWNFRIIKNINGSFGIHEVYYDDQGNVNCWSENCISPYGESFAELFSDMNKIRQAFFKPSLEIVNNTLVEMPKYNYRIRSNSNFDEDDGWLYWSNEIGWVSISDADIFSHDEMLSFNLPMNSFWEVVDGR